MPLGFDFEVLLGAQSSPGTWRGSWGEPPSPSPRCLVCIHQGPHQLLGPEAQPWARHRWVPIAEGVESDPGGLSKPERVPPHWPSRPPLFMCLPLPQRASGRQRMGPVQATSVSPLQNGTQRTPQGLKVTADGGHQPMLMFHPHLFYRGNTEAKRGGPGTRPKMSHSEAPRRVRVPTLLPAAWAISELSPALQPRLGVLLSPCSLSSLLPASLLIGLFPPERGLSRSGKSWCWAGARETF